ALVNYLSLLGWAPTDGTLPEVRTLEEFVPHFTLDHMNKTAAIFDHDKLLWMNGMYIRRNRDTACELTRTKLHANYPSFARIYPDEWFDGIIDLVIERCRTIEELVEQLTFFFQEPNGIYEAKGVKKLQGSPAIEVGLDFIETLAEQHLKRHETPVAFHDA